MSKKHKSDEDIYARTIAKMRRWKHNSFLGHCACGRSQMNAIMDSPSVTAATKAKASAINIALADLAILLKERVDG